MHFPIVENLVFKCFSSRFFDFVIKSRVDEFIFVAFVVKMMFQPGKHGGITRGGGNRFGRFENHSEGGNLRLLVLLFHS